MSERVEEAIQESKKAHLQKIEIEVSSAFVDFAKAYLQFFGSKNTVEDFLRECMYDKLESLHRDLTGFAGAEQHLLDPETWYFKHSDVAGAAFNPKEEKDEVEQ